MNVTTFPDYASALAVCGPVYNDPDGADVIAYKTALPIDPHRFLFEQEINTLMAVSIAASESADRPL
jgi:hypothetical protein